MLHKNGITVDPKELTVSHAGKTIQFRRKSGRCIRFDIVCRLVFGTPATHTQLVEDIYQNDINGGPEWAQKGIEVHLIHLRKILKGAALRIHTEKTCGNPPFDRCYVRKWIAA